MPLVDMESIVIRILSKYDIKPQLDLLGYSKSSLEIIKSAISYKSGLLLVCGATGSGKTTTLYSMLNQINDGTKKIITIEDPVEYNVSNTQQIQIEEDIGLTFELVLKNILRQDPDVIVIGEIRDKESLKIAIEASMTGHLVLATLHTNGVIESIARLFEMGMEPYFIASSLKMITSGRLIRKLCPHCKDKETKENKGCEKCNYTRYNGRTIVDETVLVSKELSELILSRASQNSIQNYLLENGIELLRSNVGDKYVLEIMHQENINFGGEQSGHIIFSDVAKTGDGLASALQVLAMIIKSGKKVSEVLNPFELSPQILKNLIVEEKPPLDSIDGLEDLLKTFRKKGLRDLIRYSGTENKIRLLLEGNDKKIVKQSMDILVEFIRSKLC
jgi:Tfp pilus assembly pilus retraction ATPase PilT